MEIDHVPETRAEATVTKTYSCCTRIATTRKTFKFDLQGAV